jgi:hypothetical protein
MFVGLLPAFRNLRAPLVAGYLLLLSAWIPLRHGVPSAAKAKGALHALYELETVTGKTGALVAATFVAFIAGSVAQFGVEILGGLRNRFRGGPQQDLEDASVISTYVEQLVADDPDLLDAAKSEYGADGLEDVDLQRAMSAAVTREIPRIARRMRGGENELYDEYDRLIGEAQLREAILLPLIVLIAVLCFTWSWYFLLAAGVLPFLKLQAASLRQDANSVVVDAVVVEKVSAPSLERLQRRVNAARSSRSADDTALEGALLGNRLS